MRVFPIAQGVRAAIRTADPIWKFGVIAGFQAFAHPRGHGDIVGSGVAEGVDSQCGTFCAGESAGLEGELDITVFFWVHDDGDGRVVLRGGAHHGRPADIDLLDARVEVRARGHRLRKRIKIYHDQFERFDVKLAELIEVLWLARVGEDARMNARMHRIKNCVIGEGAQIGARCELRDGLRVWPGVEIPDNGIRFSSDA